MAGTKADMRLVIIGGGNMGEALLRGILSAHVLAPAELMVVEPVETRREFLSRELKIVTAPDVAEAPAAANYVLAVKPQQVPAVAPQLAERLPEGGALVISIAAGISTNFLAERLGQRARIVRTMPNTPMLVGCGCTGLCLGPRATSADAAFARQIFAASGAVYDVDEKQIDAVTAVSGSGPAYFFYLIEAMTKAGVAEGLEEKTAVALACQTCAGAAKLLASSQESPETLRRKVTSPGGTTQAAISTMDAAGVAEALFNAVRAAAARSRELGK